MQPTFVTGRGRRVAAVVSVTVAEQAAGDTPAHDDAATGDDVRGNVALHEDRGGSTLSLTMPQIFEDYASDLPREFDDSPDRVLAAAQAVCRRRRRR